MACIKNLLKERIPSSRDVENVMRRLGMPTSLVELGVEKGDIPLLIKCTKNIRDKYVGTRLL